MARRLVRAQGAFPQKIIIIDNLPNNRLLRGREAVPEPFAPKPAKPGFGRLRRPLVRPAPLPGRVPISGIAAVGAALTIGEVVDNLLIPNPNHLPMPVFPVPADWYWRHGPNTYPGTTWADGARRQKNNQAYFADPHPGAETGKITGQAITGKVALGSQPAAFHTRVSYWLTANPDASGSCAQTHAWQKTNTGRENPVQQWSVVHGPPMVAVPQPALPLPRPNPEWPPLGEPVPGLHPGEMPWIIEPVPNPGRPGNLTRAGSRPPGPGAKDKKALSKAARVGIFLWGLMDTVSELSEIAGGFYDALPQEVREKWGCAKGVNIGQYGSDVNACRLDALWHYWHLVDPAEAFMNVAKNVAEDMTIGQFHVFMAKVMGKGFSVQRTVATHGLAQLEVEAYIAKRLKQLFKFLGLED